nr:TPA_asm: ATP8 [Bombus fervidus]
MPQMMPINWLMIFSMNLFCLLMLIVLINSLIILYMSTKKSKYFIYKKWMWLW